MSSDRAGLQVDWLRCRGHGVCWEAAPEVLAPDDWGYPMLLDARAEPTTAVERAVRVCPRAALRRAV